MTSGLRRIATSSALATTTSGETLTSFHSREAFSCWTMSQVAVMSTSLNTVTWGAVKAEATIASAVRLRTERMGARVVRSSLVTPAKGWSRTDFMAPPRSWGACGDSSGK